MNLPNGSRVLINDKKPNSPENSAFAINLVRNKGMENIDLSSKNVTIKDSMLFSKIEKPWGFEELIECNDKYVVKKLFMKKGNACSIQYHELKTETIVVLSGKLNIYIGDKLENLECVEYNYGDTITIKPYTIHNPPITKIIFAELIVKFSFITCFVIGCGTGGSYFVLASACAVNIVNFVFVSFICCFTGLLPPGPTGSGETWRLRAKVVVE